METTGIPIKTAKGFTLTKNLQRRGMADILVILDGKALWIEVKSPTGTQSPDQIKFQQKVNKEGCVYVLARCVDDVRDVLTFFRAAEGQHLAM